MKIRDITYKCILYPFHPHTAPIQPQQRFPLIKKNPAAKHGRRACRRRPADVATCSRAPAMRVDQVGEGDTRSI